MLLQFTRSATRDLTRLRDFIARHDPSAAARASNRLGRIIRLLTDQPGLGQTVEDLPEARDLMAGDYVVRYTVRDECVVVLRVWHGREDR
jgi:plasmid stabilization system protein ParE